MNRSFFAAVKYAANEKLVRVLLIALLALILCPHSAFAQGCTSPSFTWSGGASGSWNTTTNWTPNGTPTTSSNTCINTANSVVTVSNGSTGTLQLALSTDSLGISDNTTFTVAGSSIMNAGVLNLNSGGDNTFLDITGSTTLSGSGTLTMSDHIQNFIEGGGNLTNQSTIQGSGQIGNGALTLVNSGTIDGNQSVELLINPNGGTTNTGTLEATAAGTLLLQTDPITNTGGTILASGTNSVVNLNAVSVTGGTLSTASGGLIQAFGGTTLTTLTISSGSTVNVLDNNAVNLGAGTITNNGTINENSVGNNTFIDIAGSTTLAGTGTLTLSDHIQNFIQGGGTLTNNETIQGSGQIGNGALTLVNNGTINANQSVELVINPNGGTTNTSTMEATAGGTMEFRGDAITNTGVGTILATGTGSVVDLNGVTVNGGTLTTTAGGLMQAYSGAVLNGVTISSGSAVHVLDNNAVQLNTGTITNNGTINVDSGGNTTQLLILGGAVTLTGGGSVVLSDHQQNYIQDTTNGTTLTNVNNTISGSGQIGNGNMSLINEAGGIVDAVSSNAHSLVISPGTAVGAGTTNLGLMEASSGGTLVLNNLVTNTGGTITALSGGVVDLAGTDLLGGTLTSTGTGVINGYGGALLDGTSGHAITLTAGSNLFIPDNSSLGATGTLTNNGTLTINSTADNTFLTIASGNTLTLTGTGTLQMSNHIQNFIQGGGTLNNQETIQGSGQIGNGSLILVNSHTIDANQSVELLINPNGGTTNTGTMEATLGGTLEFRTDPVTNTGGIILASGTSSIVDLNGVSVSGGTLTSTSGGIFQAYAGTSLNTLTLSTGSTLNVLDDYTVSLGAGTITNNGAINENSVGNNTFISIAGSTTLAGTGTLTLSNHIQNFIQGGGTLTNNETIQGSGQIGNGALTLVNNGTINANQSVELVINPNGGTTNLGTMEATLGGTLEFRTDPVTNTGGIILASGTGSIVDLNGVSVSGGTLTSASGGIFQAYAGTSLNTLTLSTGSTLNILDNNTVSLGAGTITNNGTINENSVGNNTFISIAGSTTLAGTGTLTLSNHIQNFIQGGGTLTNQETIQGSGVIGNGNLTLVNNGAIDANQSTANLTINPNGNTTNTKTLEASAGGTLVFAGDSVTNTGTAATILATGTGSIVDFNGATIDGGTLTTSAGGLMQAYSGAVLNGVTLSSGSTLNVLDNNTVNIEGTITNKGTINENSGGNNTFITLLGSTTLTGTGKLVLSPHSQNFIDGTGTLTNQSTIEGEGHIGNGDIGLVNSGSILANETGTHAPSTLIIDTGAAGFTNNVGTKNGILNVSAKNTLIIEGGPFTNYSSGTLTGGTYMVTGTLEFAAGTGLVTNDATITLTGATSEIFNTSNSTNALTTFADNGTKGSFTVNGFTFTDANVFTNSGTIAVGGGAKFDSTNQLTNFNSTTSTLTGGTYNITGTGQFQFNNQGDTSDIITNAAHITLSGVDTTKPSFVDQSNNNALANFNTNASTGSLTLSADRQFTTGGSLTNAGIVDVQKSTGTGTTKLIVNGSYTQTGSGTTTVDGVLSTSTGINVSGGFIYGNAAGITNGTQGTLIGNFDLTGGTINPGDGIKKIGDLNITGTYTQSGAGILNIDLDGTTTGKWDVLNVSGAAAVGGTLNVDALTGFTPTNGEMFDILNASSVTGTFSTVDCAFSNGDSCSVTYNPTDVVVTITGGAAASASQGAVSATPAHRVSRASGDLSASSTKEPAAILSRATCFAARMIGSASCGEKASAATASHGGDMHEVASARTELNSAHNNVMVATRSISSGRGGASHETSASASAMARLYVCAYMPSSVGHTMGCN